MSAGCRGRRRGFVPGVDAARAAARTGRTRMRKLIVQQWVTVDNIAAEEDGGLSFVSGGPFSEKTNPAFKASVMALIDSVDTMILGANTYAQAKDYWPYADEQGEYGEKLNNLTKFVASPPLDDAPWGDFPAATVTRDPAPPSRSSRSRAARTSGCGAA